VGHGQGGVVVGAEQLAPNSSLAEERARILDRALGRTEGVPPNVVLPFLTIPVDVLECLPVIVPFVLQIPLYRAPVGE
jgi:hypothetical protein